MNLIHEYQFDGFSTIPSTCAIVFWKLLTKKSKTSTNMSQTANSFKWRDLGSHKLVGSYINSGQLDAQFDFNVYDAVMKVLCDDASFNVFTDVIDKSNTTEITI